ncbi:MAG: PaaX family transcriptional regulator [Microbacteriaceae bacterium]|nr:PaaX family transcriptional regulator [Microbacteriaceae bacterium]
MTRMSARAVHALRPVADAHHLPKSRQGSPTSLLLMLFGDYWLERSLPLPSAALVSLLADFDVSEVAARAALSRMVKNHLLTSSRAGRNTSYLPTPRTVGVLRSALKRMEEFGLEDRPWDGIWSVVVFDAPERNRALREAIRSRLRWLGFAPLAEGVWISPRGRHEVAINELAELGLRDATALTATVPLAGAGARRPQEAWDLEALSEEYHRFIDEAERLTSAVEAGRFDPTQALVQRTRFADDWIELASSDPDLPRELLPEDWPRGRARSAFVSTHGALGARAIERVVAAIEASAPDLAQLVVHRTFVL